MCTIVSTEECVFFEICLILKSDLMMLRFVVESQLRLRVERLAD